MMLAGFARGRRSTGKRGRCSTAKSWATGHRRPPIVNTRNFCSTCSRIAEQPLTSYSAIEFAIMQREREPPRRTGFNEIKERDGPGSTPHDGRNRRARPRRPAAAFDDMTGGEAKDQRF